MASTTNSNVHSEAEWTTVRSNPIDQINTGGIGRVPGFADAPSTHYIERINLEKQYLPSQPKSLSGIATNSFLLGFVLSTSLFSTILILAFTTSPLWRIPSFLSMLSLFHFLEFWTTAQYNTNAAQVSSFLLSQNGSAYNIAHTAAILECFVTHFLVPHWSLTLLLLPDWVKPYITASLISTGLYLVVMGQTIRSAAMIQAGTNFNHVVQHRRTNEHQLVTAGLYGYLRHPSYFGFFWWGLGTQLVLGNMFCFFGYLYVLWTFFSRRISGMFFCLVVKLTLCV